MMNWCTFGSIRLNLWMRPVLSRFCYVNGVCLCSVTVVRRRRVLRVQARAADRSPNSPVLPRVRQQFSVGVRRDSSHAAERRPTADARAAVWPLAGTHQPCALHVRHRSTSVPSLCSADSHAGVSTKYCLSHRL